VHSQSGISKRKAKKHDTIGRQRQAKEWFAGTQRQIRHRLPFQVPAEPRIYLAESKLATIAHNGTIIHAAIPNLNYAAHGDTFLQAWIGSWRKYSGAPFKSLMRILDRSLAKAATHLRKVDN
jgi:hypothetical protein